jgi:hypothetical protein
VAGKGQKEKAYRILVEKSDKRRPLESIEIYVGIILRWILRM